MNEVLFCGKWVNPWWQGSRWLPSSSSVRMNELESDWIRLSQSFVQHGWIQDGRIQDGRIQDGCHHQVQSEWMSEVFFVQIVGTNLGKFEWLWEEKLGWLNTRWPNSRWLPSLSSVQMNEFESDWIRLSQSFVQHGWIQDGRIQYGRIQDGCHH